MATNEIKLKVVADADYTDIETMEEKINHLKYQKIQAKLETDTAKLEETQNKIETVKSELQSLQGKADVDDAEVDALKTELTELEHKAINLELEVEKDKLEKAKMEVEELDDTEIDVTVNNIGAMEALDQIGQGFDRLKQGASEVGQQMGTILESAGKQETNKAFLTHAIGNADVANQKLEEINKTVQNLPGDDSIMQGLLSQAVAKDASLTAEQLQKMGTASADYFSAMAYYGKPASEAFQDMNNYLLAGNTAELERSPILANHIDKLKEATTIQERSKVLQEALNEEHWGEMSKADTYNNKLETFNGMLERGRYNLGGMFQEGAKQGMQFLLTLDESTNGLVGMGIALASFATPLTDVFMGLGQIGMGLSTLSDGFGFLKDKLNFTDKIDALKNHFGSLKTSVLNTASSIKTTFFNAMTKVSTFMKTSLIPALKSAGLSLLETGKNALIAGANALRSAGMWLVQKASAVATTISNWALAISEWAVASPIMVIIIAILALIAVLAYLYFNNEQVRQAIDWLGQSFVYVGQIIYTAIIDAVNWVIGALQNLWNYIITLGGLLPQNVSITGNQIVDTILRVLMFLWTLPMQLGMIFVNAIAKVLGFGDNFVQNMLKAGLNSVNNFMNYIRQLPSKLSAELNNMLSLVGQWASTLPQKFWEAGVNAVKNFLSALGINSPGIMQRTMAWEISEMARRTPIEARPLLANVSKMGTDIVDEFGNPKLDVGFDKVNGNVNADGSDNNANQIFNINLEVGTVDNEQRVQEIVDIIKRELSWNNQTAGRSV